MKAHPNYFDGLRKEREESKDLERSLKTLAAHRENLETRMSTLREGIGYTEGFIAAGHWTPLRQETPGILTDQIALCEDQLKLVEEEFSEKINRLLSLSGSHHFKNSWVVKLGPDKKDQD